MANVRQMSDKIYSEKAEFEVTLLAILFYYVFY